jgi:hypothetical protein
MTVFVIPQSHPVKIEPITKWIVHSIRRAGRAPLLFLSATLSLISDRMFATHAQLGLEDSLGDMLTGIFGGTHITGDNHALPKIILAAAAASRRS